MRVIASVGVLFLACATSYGDGETPPPLVSGQIGASVVANSGNTNNSTIGASGELRVQPGQFKIVAIGEFIRTETSHVVGSKRLGTSLRAEHTIPFRLSIYARGSYYEDPPSGIRQQFAVNVGGIAHLLRGERCTLAASLSLGRTREHRIVSPDLDFLGIETGLEMTAKANDTVSVESTANYVRDFSDSENWRMRTATSLVASFSKRFAFKFTHQLYRNRPDQGKRATDQTMMASLVMYLPSAHGK